MAKFEEIVERFTKSKSNINLDSLIRLVESELSLAAAGRESLSEKSEQPEETKGISKPKEVTLLMPDFQLDASWLSIEKRGVAYTQERQKLSRAIDSLGVTRDIRNLDIFIKSMNSFLKSEVDVSDHSEALSRIQVLRIFYNLLRTPDAQVAGYLFEVLLALVFGGERIRPGSQEEKEQGVVDVVFPQEAVSIKLVSHGDTKIKASGKGLQAALERHPEGFTYIIAGKIGDKLMFESLVFNDDVVAAFKSKSKYVRRKGRKRKSDPFKPGDPLINQDPASGLSKSMSAIKRHIGVGSTKDGEGMKVDRLDSQGMASTLINQAVYKNLGTIDFAGVEQKTQEILSALDNKFNSLLTNLEDLSEKSVDLLYSDSKFVKGKSASVAKSADDVAASARKI